jgi:hypothetical protein
MSLRIRTRAVCTEEKRYAIDVVCRRWLGLEPVIEWADVDGYELVSPTGVLRLPDTVLAAIAAAGWGAAQVMSNWRHDCVLEREDGGAPLPILCAPVARQQTADHDLGLDVFGHAFLYLSGYEELIVTDRDGHDRFPMRASLAHRCGVVERPLLDEYMEQFRAALARRCGLTGAHGPAPGIEVSHDIDQLLWFGHGNTSLVRLMAADLLKRRAPGLALSRPAAWWAARGGLHHRDPYFTFDWLMDTVEQAGLRSTFYFLVDTPGGRFGPDYTLDHPALAGVLQSIHARGHRIGLHAAYDSFRSPDSMARGLDTLRARCAALGISQDRWSNRQHVLRWDATRSPAVLEAAGITHDSSVGFAERPGFRAGTARSYPLYDLLARRVLRVIEQPLILMETSLFSRNYLGLAPGTRALAMARAVQSRCTAPGAVFTLLWHNSKLLGATDRDMFRALLEGC